MSNLPKECYVVYGIDAVGKNTFVLAAFSNEDDAYEYLAKLDDLDSIPFIGVGNCDICSKEIGMNNLNIMRCDNCDYDECIECFEKAAHQKHKCELINIQQKIKEMQTVKIEKIRARGFLRNNTGYYKVGCVPFNEDLAQ